MFHRSLAWLFSAILAGSLSALGSCVAIMGCEFDWVVALSFIYATCAVAEIIYLGWLFVAPAPMLAGVIRPASRHIRD